MDFGTIGSDLMSRSSQGRLMGVKIKPNAGIYEMMG
jgi:hypothetical protein